VSPVAQQDLSQDEIDHLTESLQGAADIDPIETEVTTTEKLDALKRKSKNVHTLSKRLYYLMMVRADFDKVNDARRDLHNAKFGLWCANRSMEKKDYYLMIKKELKKRGLLYVSVNPPGYKLMRTGG